MGKAKTKIKRNVSPLDESLSKEEFIALIKGAEKGPFKPFSGVEDDDLLTWKKKTNSRVSTDNAIPAELQNDYLSQLKKAEKGPFYSHSELVDKLNAWKKSLKK